MLDLPAPLVEATLNWIACDECGGRELVPICSCPPPYDDCTHHPDLCPRPHVVVTFVDRTIHADPDRVRQECSTHRDQLWGMHPARGDSGEDLGCTPVLRPVVPIDLKEFASQFDAMEPQVDRTWPP